MRVLFVHQALMSFVERDLRILQDAHDVRELVWRGFRDLGRLWAGVRWCDVVFCWFGKLHAYFAVKLAKRYGKGAVIVAGGDDVAREPDISYGMYSFWWKRWCPNYVFRHADLVLCVSESNQRETLLNTAVDPQRASVLYHGFDADRWAPTRAAREPTALTVGRITRETVVTKGLATFVEAGRLLPDVEFVLVGPSSDGAAAALRAKAPPNVHLVGPRYGADLIRAYSEAKVYVQPSLHESFGCSVAEAMLCECVPVVSRRGALPEVVGDCGFYADPPTPENVAAAVRQALQSDLGPRARQRIIDCFPLEKRRQALLEAVRQVTQR